MENKAHWAGRTALFLTGQTITLFGSAIVQFAINWHITLTTKSGAMLTIATLCGFLPQLVISLFAGVWADRFDKKKLIILADSMIAVFTLGLAVTYMAGYEAIWPLFIISAVRSVGGGIQMPAVSAFLPELVPGEQLLRVNGINASIQGVMMLLSPVAAGALYAALGLGIVFWVDVATAVMGIVLLVILKSPERATRKTEHPHFFADMLIGIKYVAKTVWLRQFLTVFMLLTLGMGPIVFLTPLMVARSFGDEAWRLVVHECVFAGGATLGGIVVGLVGAKFKNKINMVISSVTLFGVLTFIMGLSPNFWFYLGVMLPMGISMPFMNTGAMTVLQTKTDPDLIGRVFGLVSIINSSGLPLSMAIFGPLSDVMKIEHQLLLTGVMMTVLSLSMLALREMRRAGE